VKRLVSAALMAALMAACSAMTAQAQGTAPPRPTVAIIDLSYVFKNYSKFNELTANMKRQVEAADAQLKGRQEELKAIAKQFSELPLGNPERDKLEEQATEMDASIKVEVANQRKDFLRQEAQIYYNVYREVQDTIKRYCDQNGIVLVMRFNGEPPDPNNPQEVMQDLNKAVVYYHRAIDITFPIKEALEQTHGGGTPVTQQQRPPVGQQPAGVRPRTGGVPPRTSTK
jgi:Skp family chaperone for outer membrane proteins